MCQFAKRIKASLYHGMVEIGPASGVESPPDCDCAVGLLCSRELLAVTLLIVQSLISWSKWELLFCAKPFMAVIVVMAPVDKATTVTDD